jgi:hypothetical protein
MAPLGQAAHNLRAHRILQEQVSRRSAIFELKTSPVQGSLRVYPVVEQCRYNLEMTLGLHHTPHDAEDGVQAAVAHARQKTRYDGVVGTLSGLQAVGMSGFQAEAQPAVLQCIATALRNNTGAEVLKGAVDKRAAIALSVDRGEVNRIRPPCQGFRIPLVRISVGLLGIYKTGPDPSVFLRE